LGPIAAARVVPKVDRVRTCDQLHPPPPLSNFVGVSATVPTKAAQRGFLVDPAHDLLEEGFAKQPCLAVIRHVIEPPRVKRRESKSRHHSHPPSYVMFRQTPPLLASPKSCNIWRPLILNWLPTSMV
jgi:hypothetical protein